MLIFIVPSISPVSFHVSDTVGIERIYLHYSFNDFYQSHPTHPARLEFMRKGLVSIPIDPLLFKRKAFFPTLGYLKSVLRLPRLCKAQLASKKGAEKMLYLRL